jgi:hypothetical protein
VRAGIERAWLAADMDGDAPDLPAGLGFQWRQELTYDPQMAIAKVVEWGFWHLLSLDRRGFEQIARNRAEEGAPLAFVSYGKRLVPTIAVDLSAKLSGEAGPTRKEVEATVRRDQAHGVSAHLATEPREKE